MENYGAITHESKTITLTEQAYNTSRVLNEYPQDKQYNGDGDSYMVEYEAHGTDENGQAVIVRWHFEVAREGCQVEGAYPYETLEEDYDWDKLESVRPDPYASDF